MEHIEEFSFTGFLQDLISCHQKFTCALAEIPCRKDGNLGCDGVSSWGPGGVLSLGKGGQRTSWCGESGLLLDLLPSWGDLRSQLMLTEP